MRGTLALGLAAFAALLAAPSVAAGCPAEPPSPPMFPDCTDAPVLLSAGECVSYGLAWTHANQVWVGDIIRCA
jgi:hypothetical protein